MLAHIIEKIKQHKEASHLTTQQIADRSGVPASTISRILSGQTDSPNVHNLAAICRAVGVSLDELFGIIPPEQPKAETPQPAPQPVPAADHAAELLEAYRTQLANKDSWLKRLFFVCIALIGAWVVMTFIDALNGGIGWIKY